ALHLLLQDALKPLPFFQEQRRRIPQCADDDLHQHRDDEWSRVNRHRLHGPRSGKDWRDDGDGPSCRESIQQEFQMAKFGMTTPDGEALAARDRGPAFDRAETSAPTESPRPAWSGPVREATRRPRRMSCRRAALGDRSLPV